MGRLLEALRTNCKSSGVAKAANLRKQPERFADSQDSQSITDSIRAHLLKLAAAEGVNAAHVQSLQDDDLVECRGLSNATLRDWLRLRQTTACMDAGQAPPDYTKTVNCSGCGPVLLWSGCPDRVIACPWCFRRKAGKAILRPPASTVERNRP